MGSYRDNMWRLGITQLARYAGKDIISHVVEWYPEAPCLGKEQLIAIISEVYGDRILENKDFRYDILCSMDEETLLRLCRELIPGGGHLSFIEACRALANYPWGNNRVTRSLLNEWGVNGDLFSDTPVAEYTKKSVVPHDKFYELLDYQYYIERRVLANINSGRLQERMLVQMPTGTGKTKTAMHVIANFLNFHERGDGLVLWVAHSKELLEQAEATFMNVWSALGHRAIDIRWLFNTSKLPDDKEPLTGIMFCGVSKLLSIKRNKPDFFDRLHRACTLIVFDEAHRASADETRNVIESLMRTPEGVRDRALIGLSATPGRTTSYSVDNMVLTAMFGGELIGIDAALVENMSRNKQDALNSKVPENTIALLQEKGVLARLESERLHYRTKFSENDFNILKKMIAHHGYDTDSVTNEQLEVLARNVDRNRAIRTKLVELAIKKVPTIVFACSVSHAKLIAAMLSIEKVRCSLVYGDMHPSDRKKAIDDFKSGVTDVIVNYGVLTTGFDATRIRCVFITRPTSSIVLYSQMIGRGLRGPLMGGNKSCLLIDIDDNLSAYGCEDAFNHFNDYWLI